MSLSSYFSVIQYVRIRKSIEIKCSYCNNTFFYPEHRFKEKSKCGQKGFFCSKNCKTESRLKIFIEEISCPLCNSLFKRYKNRKNKNKFCSRICANKYSNSFLDKNKALDNFYKHCLFKGLEKCKLLNISKRKYKKCLGCESKIFGIKKYCSLICYKSNSKNISEKISKSRKEKFKSGELNITGGNTKWYNYNNLRVQGSFELRACKILDSLKNRGLINNWDKSKKRVCYIGEDGVNHNYLIDFEILTKSNKILYLEIKGYTRPNDLLKWSQVRKDGHILLVWMEKHLNLIEDKLQIID